MIGEGERFEVAIVGAGPAGSSAAIRLGRGGRKVLLIDRAKFPRDKLCGEFVSPECLAHFDDLEVTDRIFSLVPPRLSKTVFHSSYGQSLSIPNEWLSTNDDKSIGISRFALDHILLKRAGTYGVDIRENTSLVGPLFENGAVCGLVLRDGEGRKYNVQSPIVIDATGRGRYLAKGFDRVRKPAKAEQVAFKAHMRGPKIESQYCELFRFDGGYGGSSQIEGGIYDLCFVVDSERVRAIGNDPIAIFERTFLTNPRAKQVLSDYEVVSDWLSVPLVNYGFAAASPLTGVLAIGDAGAFIDPFTGSGIALALQSSEIASSAVLNGQDVETISQNYSRMHSAKFKRRLKASARLRAISKSKLLTELLIAVLGSSNVVSKFVARSTRGSSMRERDGEIN